MKEQATGIIEIVKNVLDIFVTKEGKVSPGKLSLSMFLLFLGLGYYHRSEIADFWVKVNAKHIEEELNEKWYEDRDLRYKSAIRLQVDNLYALHDPRAVGVFIYEPTDNPERELLKYYKGSLPEGTTEEDWLGRPIDTMTKEFSNHNRWLPWYTHWGEHFFPRVEDMDKYLDKPWQYSCPVYSIDHKYIGYISLYWSKPPEEFKVAHVNFMSRVFATCTSASRKIGVLHATDGLTW